MTSGEILEADEVILGLGYNIDFSYLDNKILKLLNYNASNKHFPLSLLGSCVFNKDVKNLAFIGFAPFDVVMSSFEFQAIIALNYLQSLDFEDYKKKYKIFENKDIDYIDHREYLEFLADEAGVLPDFEEIKKDAELYDYIMDGPNMIHHFLLTKKNVETDIWKMNAEMIKKFNKELNRNFLI